MAEETIETNLMACNAKTLDALMGTTLLSQEDLTKYKDCLPAIEHAFFHVQMFRTPTEMMVSVLNDVHYPTTDAKYWQSIREMNVMVENLIMLSFKYKEKLLDLEELNLEKEKIERENPEYPEVNRIATERKNIAINKAGFEIACIQREAHHRIREIDEWKAIQDQLLPHIVAGSDDVDRHQLFSYTLRFLKEFYFAETGNVKKDLDSYRNLRSHVVSSLAFIERSKLTPTLVESLSHDPELMRFVKKQNLIK
jgi:hypothetical protein